MAEPIDFKKQFNTPDSNASQEEWDRWAEEFVTGKKRPVPEIPKVSDPEVPLQQKVKDLKVEPEKTIQEFKPSDKDVRPFINEPKQVPANYPSEDILQRPQINTGIERQVKYPITTSGQPSAPAAIQQFLSLSESERAKIISNIAPGEKKTLLERAHAEFTKQSLLPPEQRTGVMGVMSSIFPEIKKQGDEGEFQRNIVEGALPYTFRLLNLPSAAVGSLGETIAETVGLGTIKDEMKGKGFQQRMLSNMARQVGKGEGLPELGEKAGQTAEKFLNKNVGSQTSRIATGLATGGTSLILEQVYNDMTKSPYVPEKMKNIIKDKVRPVELSDLGWLAGLTTDVLLPSSIELGYIGLKSGTGIAESAGKRMAGNEIFKEIKTPTPPKSTPPPTPSTPPPPVDPNVRAEANDLLDPIVEEINIFYNVPKRKADLERVINSDTSSRSAGVIEDRYWGPVHSDHPIFSGQVKQVDSPNLADYKYHDVQKKLYTDNSIILNKYGSPEQARLKATPEEKSVMEDFKTASKLINDLFKLSLTDWQDPTKLKVIQEQMDVLDSLIRSFQERNPERWSGWFDRYQKLNLKPEEIKLNEYGGITTETSKELQKRFEIDLKDLELETARIDDNKKISSAASQDSLNLTMENKRTSIVVEDPRYDIHYRGSSSVEPSPLGKVAMILFDPAKETPASVIAKLPADLKTKYGLDGIILTDNIVADLLIDRPILGTKSSKGIYYKYDGDKLIPDRAVAQRAKTSGLVQDKIDIEEKLFQMENPSGINLEQLNDSIAKLKNRTELLKRKVEQGKFATERVEAARELILDNEKQIDSMLEKVNKNYNDPVKRKQLEDAVRKLNDQITELEREVDRGVSKLFTMSGGKVDDQVLPSVAQSISGKEISNRIIANQTKRINELTPDVGGRGPSAADKLFDAIQNIKGKNPKGPPGSRNDLRKLREIFDSYRNTLNGLGERWKYFARKYKPNQEVSSFDEAFSELSDPIQLNDNLIDNIAAVLSREVFELNVRGSSTPLTIERNQELIYNTLRKFFKEQRFDFTEKKPMDVIRTLLDSARNKFDSNYQTTKELDPNYIFNIKKDPTIENLLPDIYMEAYTENAARQVSKSLSDYGYSIMNQDTLSAFKASSKVPELKSDTGYPREKLWESARKELSPEEIRESVLRNLTSNKQSKVDLGYIDLLTDIANKQIDKTIDRLDEFLKSKSIPKEDKDFYRTIRKEYGYRNNPGQLRIDYVSQKVAEWVDKKVGYELVQAIEEGIDVMSLANSARQIVESKFVRDRLAASFAADPWLARQVEYLPENIRDRGSKYVVDQLAGLLSSNKPEEVSLGLRTVRGLSELSYNVQQVMKGAILGGSILPNPAYHMVNIATAPLIIYQNLGLKSALTSMNELPSAFKLISHIYGDKSIAPSLNFITPNKVYDAQDVIKLFQENGLASSQTNFELAGSLRRDMGSYIQTGTGGELIPRGRMERRSPVLISDNIFQLSPVINRNGVRDIIGLNGPNFWNEAATATDNTYRMAVLIDSLKAGDSEAVAIQKARESLFDYEKVSDFEKAAFRNLLWFQSFWRHNIASTFRSLLSPQGSTRIKNALRLTKDRPEAENDYSTAKPYLGSNISGTKDTFGPGIPTAEAMNFIYSQFNALLGLLGGVGAGVGRGILYPRDYPPRDNMSIPGLGEILKEEQDLITDKLSSNKLLGLFANVVGNYDIQNKRQVRNTLDSNYENIFRLMGLLDDSSHYNPEGLAVSLFDLKYNPQYQNYEFNSVAGRNKFIVFKNGFGDIIAGRYPGIVGGTLEPSVQNIDRGKEPEIIETIEQGGLRGIGLTTSYQKKRLRELLENRDRDLKSRLKQ